MTHPDVGVHTRGQLTFFEAFFVLRDGNPSKSNQRAKIRNPSGRDSRGWESPLPCPAAEFVPVLFILARSHCVGSPRPLIVSKTRRVSRATGQSPGCLRIPGDNFSEKKQTEKKPRSRATGPKVAT